MVGTSTSDHLSRNVRKKRPQNHRIKAVETVMSYLVVHRQLGEKPRNGQSRALMMGIKVGAPIRKLFSPLTGWFHSPSFTIYHKIHGTT